MAPQILNIRPGSDGDGRRRPKTNDFTRNDDYYLERIATDYWAKSLGIKRPDVTYRLDQLPHGYAGYEKVRASNDKHTDRYVYGHPNGVFRSLNEFWPHFKFLMDNGNAFGCTCKLCSGGRSTGKRRSSVRGAADSEGGSARGGSPAQTSPFFAQPQLPAKTKQKQRQPQTQADQVSRGRPRAGLEHLIQGRPPSEPPVQPRRKQVDEEGTPDVYRALIGKLKAAGSEGKVDESITQTMSPDWRTGHTMLMQLLREWNQLLNYVPRTGEVVMFVRHIGPHETLGWDAQMQTFRVIDLHSHSWLDRPKWEAGVVTQMPTEAITDEDLSGTPTNKRHSVINSGFRIEPMSQTNSISKQYSKQHKYVPLHAIRPLTMYTDCLQGIEPKDWHSTIGHALATTSSLCLIGSYHFKGVWPEATVFAQGIYIGSEVITIGDAVRLLPRSGDVITDVMVVTAIKMRIVRLDEVSDDDYDDGHPYITCTHISGRTYTQDPTRSYDGIGKVPIAQGSLPDTLRDQGTWFHVTDPKKNKARIEVPFQRVIGRCYDSAALKAWFTPPNSLPPPTAGFKAVNATPTITVTNPGGTSADFSRGLEGVKQARTYSQQHDSRIDKDSGKTWFWADTRVEQLDLHEVNGRYVGIRDDTRNRQKIEGWRKALRALDGKKGGLEEYHAARREREQAQASSQGALGASSSGLVASGAQAVGVSATEADDSGEVDDAMEVDEDIEVGRAGASDMQMETEDASDTEVDGGNALAAFKAAPMAAKPEVITLDDGSDDDEEDEDDD